MTRTFRIQLRITIAAIALASFGSMPAFAYTGPGAGITALGSLMALAAAIVLALVGFVWYPAKRLIKLLRGAKKRSAETLTTPTQ